jgi:PAS domain S-box-containing protein
VTALVALLLAGVSVLLRASAAETAHRASGEADAAGGMLERLLASVATLETAERGYAYTGKELEAKALQTAAAQVEAALSSLLPVITPLAADAPVDRLKVLVAEALDSSRETVRLRRTDGQESGLRHAVSDDDRALADQLQATAKEIAVAARQRADVRDAAARRQALLWGVAAGVFGLVALVGIAMALVGKPQAEAGPVDEYRVGARDAGPEVPLSAMLSALDEAVLAIDAHGKVVASNAAADTLLGLGEAGGGTRTPPALYAPDAGKKTPPTESPLLRALKGQPVRNALLSVGRPNENGSRRVSVSAKPISEDGRIRGAVMVIRDASATKAGAAKHDGAAAPEAAGAPAAAARPPHETFAKAFETAPAAIGLLGLDGRLARVNGAFCRLVGCGPDDLVGRDPASLVPREDAAREESLLRGLLAGETPSYEIEKRFAVGTRGKEKGNGRPVRWAVSAVRGPGGEVVGALAFVDELREKRSSDRSRGGQDLLRLVLDALPIGVWITDVAGKVTLANPAGRKIWGKDEGVARFEPTEYKGFWADSGKRIEPDEWGALHAIGTGEAQVDKAIEVQRFDGSRKTLLTSAVPYRGGDGAVTGAIVVQQELPTSGPGKDADAANAEIASLKALIPLCPACENKREDASYWKDVRTYVRENRASLREATCGECSSRAYDLWSELIDEKTIL